MIITTIDEGKECMGVVLNADKMVVDIELLKLCINIGVNEQAKALVERMMDNLAIVSIERHDNRIVVVDEEVYWRNNA